MTPPKQVDTEEEAYFTSLREAMVKDYLIDPPDNRPVIKDQKVLDAMRQVRRHKFVPKEIQKYSYIDGPLPIGWDQTISQPYMVALMTQYLELKGNEKVLEVGAGSGYQAAVLAKIVKEVYTIEILESLYQRATKTLQQLGYNNVKTKLGDGYLGWEEYAPFDRVIITCSVTRIPEPLLKQLKDGGLIILPIGKTFKESVLSVARKQKDKIISTPIIPCRFVPMTGKMQE